MNLVTLDFETFFDQEYKLGKLTTEEYVRDPRFKVHCTGWKADDKPAYVMDEPRGVYAAHLRESAIVCHHAQFDGLILSHHYGIRPAFWFDTLSMARLVFPHAKSHSLEALAEMLGIGRKKMPYEDFKGVRDLPPDLYNRVAAGCANDVELTYAVFQKMLPYVPKDELRLIDLTVRMFTEPALCFDRERLQAYLEKTQAEKEQLLQSLGVDAAQLHSSEKFAELLRRLGVEPPTKASPRVEGKSIYAFAKTDEAMKELLDHENDTVAGLAAARLGQKSTLGETRAERLLGMGCRGALPVYLKYAGAHTLRWSGGDAVNFQNLPRGSEHRKVLMAPVGYALVVADLAQIECRILNWLAGQQDVLEMFRAGKDVYCEQASRALGRTITKADKAERQLFKTAELGLGYGMGAEKFASALKQQGITADAKAMVQIYRQTHPEVVGLWKQANTWLNCIPNAPKPHKLTDVLTLQNYRIYGPGGTWLDYANLAYDADAREFYVTTRHGRSKMYGAKLVENVVQYLARLVLGEAMLKIAKRYRIVLTAHDEVVYLAPEKEAAEALEFGLQIMKTPPEWCSDCPLDAEGSYGERYSK